MKQFLKREEFYRMVKLGVIDFLSRGEEADNARDLPFRDQLF